MAEIIEFVTGRNMLRNSENILLLHGSQIEVNWTSKIKRSRTNHILENWGCLDLPPAILNKVGHGKYHAVL